MITAAIAAASRSRKLASGTIVLTSLGTLQTMYHGWVLLDDDGTRGLTTTTVDDDGGRACSCCFPRRKKAISYLCREKLGLVEWDPDFLPKPGAAKLIPSDTGILVALKRVAVQGLIFMYVPLVVFAATLLNCTDILDDGTRVIATDYAYECPADAMKVYFYLAWVIVIFVGIIFPVWMSLLLRQRYKINKKLQDSIATPVRALTRMEHLPAQRFQQQQA